MARFTVAGFEDPVGTPEPRPIAPAVGAPAIEACALKSLIAVKPLFILFETIPTQSLIVFWLLFAAFARACAKQIEPMKSLIALPAPFIAPLTVLTKPPRVFATPETASIIGFT